jgi:hypothetical protein
MVYRWAIFALVLIVSSAARAGIEPEAEHFFRCKACNGWIDARDLVWIEDHEGTLPHPAQDQPQ